MLHVTTNHIRASQPAHMVGEATALSLLEKKDAQRNPAIRGIKAFLGTERTV